MRRELMCFLAALCLLTGCSTKTSVQVPRNPTIKFDYGAVTWEENVYSFQPTVRTVAYPSDTLQSGHLYTRYSLQAIGHDSKGKSLQLNISFDASDETQLVGTYSSYYTLTTGLAQAEILDLDANNLSEYGMCPNDTVSFLQVERQSLAEQLIAGNFELHLCNARDSSRKIFLTNGIFTDIHY